MSVSGVSVAAAFAGGFASFASPCVLPLAPVYLSVVGALDLTRRVDAGDTAPEGSYPEASQDPPGSAGTATALRSRRSRGVGAITRDTLFFIGGFTLVFVLLGLSASAVGRYVIHQQATLTRVSGVVVVAMAMFLLGGSLLERPGFYREFRIHPRLARLGPFAAPIAGAAFAFGWTPCVGPILASVLALSAQQGHVATSAVLLSVYSLGLGVPFLALALLFDKLSAPLTWLRRHGRAVTFTSSSVMAVMGVLLVTDRLAWVTTFLTQSL